MQEWISFFSYYPTSKTLLCSVIILGQVSRTIVSMLAGEDPREHHRVASRQVIIRLKRLSRVSVDKGHMPLGLSIFGLSRRSSRERLGLGFQWLCCLGAS